MEWNVEGKMQWVVQAVVAHDDGSVRMLGHPKQSI
jgi:hypothetical protein